LLGNLVLRIGLIEFFSNFIIFFSIYLLACYATPVLGCVRTFLEGLRNDSTFCEVGKVTNATENHFFENGRFSRVRAYILIKKQQ